MPTTKIELTPELENKIYELYKETKSTVKMQEMLGIERKTISKIINQSGLRRQLDNDRNSEILSLYSIYNNANKVAKIMNLTCGTITKFLKKQGVSVGLEKLSEITPKIELEILRLYEIHRKRGKVKQALLPDTHATDRDIVAVLNKYNIKPDKSKIGQRYKIIDYHCFDNLDAAWKLYFLGLIYADGNLCRNAISVSLQDRDKYILDIFSKLIFEDRPPLLVPKTKPHYRDMYKLSIQSNYIYDKFLGYGLYPNKSLTIDFPKYISDSPFISDFVRGHFDGDGGIGERQLKNGKHHYYVFICGSNKFINFLCELLRQNNIPAYVRPDGNISTVTIGSKIGIKKFYEFIYRNNPNIYFIRKRDRFERFLKEYPDIQDSKPTSRYKHISKSSICKSWIVNYKGKYLASLPSEEEAYSFLQNYLRENNLSPVNDKWNKHIL